MNKLRTQFDFECAHRLYNVNTYSKECRNNIHGHSYKVTVVVGADTLDDSGMVCDFKLLKNTLKGYFDSYDHACILQVTDPLVGPICDNCEKVHVTQENPTAEWMAETFYTECNNIVRYNIRKDLRVLQVQVQETENNIAIYEE